MEVEAPVINDGGVTFTVDTYAEMMSTIVGVMNAVGDAGNPDAVQASAAEHDAAPTGSDPTAASEAADNVDGVPDEAQAESTRKSIKCSLCPGTFANNADYNNHVESHIRRRDSQYICDFCNKVFLNFDRITLHFYARHKRGLPKTCSECFRTFNNKRTLNKHKRSRHPPIHQRRVVPPSNPRMHRRLLTYLVNSDSAVSRDGSVVFPDRIVETHIRAPANPPQGYGSSSDFGDTDNPREYVRYTTPRDINMGTANEITPKVGTASVGTTTEIGSVATVSVGTDNVETASVGTDNVETASVGTDSVDSASVGTDNMETANVGTVNVETNNVTNATTGNANNGTSSDGIFRITMM